MVDKIGLAFGLGCIATLFAVIIAIVLFEKITACANNDSNSDKAQELIIKGLENALVNLGRDSMMMSLDMEYVVKALIYLISDDPERSVGKLYGKPE